ncbi:MAG: VOC family protein [Gaiellales bacterium]
MTASATDSTPGDALDPESVTYGAVHLDIVDPERSLAFWRDLLGLEQLERSDEEIRLGAGGRELIVLRPGAVRGTLRGHAGIYHVAIHLPDAGEFARMIMRLATARAPQSPTDHVFSKATYLSDPDGIGLELTLETPERFAGFEIEPARIVIRDSDGRARGGTEPLDVDEALSHLGDRDIERPLPAGTKVGHVHLHVGDLTEAWSFYRDMIGFREHMYMPEIGMADLSAGGRFPHRLAINVWQGPGVVQPPPGTAGLHRVELVVPTAAALEGIRAGLEARSLAFETDAAGLTTRDPAGNPLRVIAPGA